METEECVWFFFILHETQDWHDRCLSVEYKKKELKYKVQWNGGNVNVKENKKNLSSSKLPIPISVDRP